MAWMLGACHRGGPPPALAPWAGSHRPGSIRSELWARAVPWPPRC